MFFGGHSVDAKRHGRFKVGDVWRVFWSPQSVQLRAL